jgi:hypothetical protein
MPSQKCEISGSLKLAEENVCSRTEHDFRYAVEFAWRRLGLPASRVPILIPELALQHLGFSENCADSPLPILAQFLKSRIAAQWVPPGIEAEQRRSERSQASRR